MTGIQSEAIDHKKAVHSVETASAGAIVTFDGRVRDSSRGKSVLHLVYEAYEPMARKEMEGIEQQLLSKWPVERVTIIHRVGRLEVGETSVFVAVSAAHRDAAFSACRFAIDTLKKTVPIWKKEVYVDGEVWIDEHP